MKLIRWLPSARNDLAGIQEYISRDKPGTARAVVDRLLQSVKAPREASVVGSHRTGIQRSAVPGDLRLQLPRHLPSPGRRGTDPLRAPRGDAVG